MFQIYSTKESIKLTKQLSKGFRRSVFWNEYKSKIETYELDNGTVIIESNKIVIKNIFCQE